MPMELEFFVKLKYQTSTIMLPLSVKYSMRDLICDVNYCLWPAKLRYSVHKVYTVWQKSIPWYIFQLS